MEKIIIIDENDEQIGTENIEKIDLKDIYRVSALWIENSQGEVLLAQRSFNKIKHSRKLGPVVAGTVRADEDYDLNIYKETEEEIGLTGETFMKAHKIRQTGKTDSFVSGIF